MHKARSGDTLIMLAKRYATTIEAIQSANGLKTIDLKIGRTYKIPVPKAPARAAAKHSSPPKSKQKPSTRGGKSTTKAGASRR
jgi:membrane-bound lytic murein transglycosylase D